MKNIIIILTISLVFISCEKGRTQNTKSIKVEINKKLSTFIDSLYTVDQKVQNDLVKAFQNGISGDSLKTYFANIPLVYKRHLPILKKIVKNNGYPTIKKVGKESSNHFFVMVQHCDMDVAFQNEMLVNIKKEFELGNVIGKDLGMLTDRVYLAQGKQQLYGSQLEYIDGKASPKNLYKPEECTKRRAKLNMESLEDYLKYMTALHQKQNKKE